MLALLSLHLVSPCWLCSVLHLVFVLALLSLAPGVLLARSALPLVCLLVLGSVQHLHLLHPLAPLSPAPAVLLAS